MCDPTEPLEFPDLPDEAVIAINDFLEELYVHFQNHYFSQMHRHDRQHRKPRSPPRQLALPLLLPIPDPPF